MCILSEHLTYPYKCIPMPQTKNTTEIAGRPHATTEEDESGIQPTTKECLKEISTKLSTVIFTLNTLNENIVEVKEQLSTRRVPPLDASFSTLGGTLEKINDVLEKINIQENEPTTSQQPDMANIHIEENALRIKNKLSQIWENNLRARKSLYWQALRNKNLSTTFEEWLQEDPVILPQWVQIKHIANEPSNVTQRREKQAMDNFQAEKELLLLRSESQETKYKDLDSKVISEIEKLATGQSRNMLLNMWQEDCKRNEEISKKRWQNKNHSWLNRYKENFKVTYQNKSPFIKAEDKTEGNKTYATAAATQPHTGSQQQATVGNLKRNNNITKRQQPAQQEEQQNGQRHIQGESSIKEMPLPQRPPRNQRETRQNQTVGRQSSPREIPEMQGATSTAPIYIDLDTDTGNNTQVNF